MALLLDIPDLDAVMAATETEAAADEVPRRLEALAPAVRRDTMPARL